ncbi:MAG: 23S rRNA (adenine(2503)-C(2))-methyltransferase RlmN [Acidimicrobiia bacterium]|nr:23S rRNA (adenine(2503)-C(2))-methyltransferase RlmN [Acidimicrobiia bacterium]
MAGIYQLDEAALAELLSDEPSYRVDQVIDGVYRQGVPVTELTNLPRALRQRLAETHPPDLNVAAESVGDGGDTVKWLWELHDGTRVETVLMTYPDRATVCVSTQAGCAMACSFCATGQAGFDRHLEVGEIVEQVARARQRAAPRRVSNVVFMGMGEPLANYDRTWAAVERLQGPMGISARHLTVSTVGVVPGIRRLATERLPVRLAVSLHAADDELRNELVPLNRRHPIEELLDACEEWTTRTRRRLSFEWAMIDGVNDRSHDARALAPLARRLRAHVNLIPLNPTPGYPVVGSSPKRVAGFADELRSMGVNATVRANRGTTIDAACGQLRAAQAVAPATANVAAPRRR